MTSKTSYISGKVIDKNAKVAKCNIFYSTTTMGVSDLG